MSNYSYETSYPPYKENEALNKRTQCDEVLQIIKHGANNLLQISQVTGLPQSTIAARINDLASEKKIEYSGFTVYNNRKRKKIILIKPVVNGMQASIF